MKAVVSHLTFLRLAALFTFMSVTLNEAAQIIGRSLKDKAVSLVHLSNVSQKQGCPTLLAIGHNIYCGLVLQAAYVKTTESVVENHVSLL